MLPTPDAPVLTPQLLRAWPLPEADDDGDKLDRGTALVVGGDLSTPGAVLLAGVAALRVGAGRLQLATVPGTATALGVAVPEAKVTGLPPEELGEVPLDGVSAVLIGPGLMSEAVAATVLGTLLPRLEGRPVVLDALALHVVDAAPPWPAVLTPNGTELRVLAGAGQDDVDNGVLARQVAQDCRAVVATQGWVAHPDGRAWREEGGSVGLATSGSGDVLAGAVLGLLARGADPVQAACWGQHLHGAAGDRLVVTRGRTGFLARELLDVLPAELLSLTA